MQLSRSCFGIIPLALSVHGLPFIHNNVDVDVDVDAAAKVAPRDLPPPSDPLWDMPAIWQEELGVGVQDWPDRSRKDRPFLDRHMDAKLLPDPSIPLPFNPQRPVEIHHLEDYWDSPAPHDTDESDHQVGDETIYQDMDESHNTERSDLDMTDLQQEDQPNPREAPDRHKIERRREDTSDRRQQDQSKPIDFSLLTPCIEHCFRKFDHVAPKSINEVSIADWCEDKEARWRWWMDFGPIQCLAFTCRTRNTKEGSISRKWHKDNCGW